MIHTSNMVWKINRIKENSRNQFKVANIHLMEKSLLWTDHHSEYKEYNLYKSTGLN